MDGVKNVNNLYETSFSVFFPILINLKQELWL
jgi:hypothetical protein